MRGDESWVGFSFSPTRFFGVTCGGKKVFENKLENLRTMFYVKPLLNPFLILGCLGKKLF